MISRTVLEAIRASDAVRQVSDDAMRRRAVPVYRLHAPARDEVAAEARRWAQLLGVAHGARHLDPCETTHANRLVLTHADDVRVSAAAE